MKIFKKLFCAIKKNPMLICAIVLFTLLVSMQTVNLSKVKKTSVSPQSGSSADDMHSAELVLESGKESDKIEILVNGENRVNFSERKAIISFDMSSSVEIKNMTGGDITVRVENFSDDLTFLGNSKTIKCKRGITYLCRFVL